MALAAGTRIGPYQIVSAIGAGGMGEVYRARDARLGRDVAVKTLPPLTAGDPERVVRFQREAQILAALNHQNIAAIYGLEEAPLADGSSVIVMEIIEGGTLAERLRSGPVPLIEALTMARQVADALHAAHDKGIIHRDLKPANIGLTADGQVKVLDFGLAKAFEPDANSPTMALAATRSGVVLGTVAYMSPEQARGLPLDRRTDIWAFGCVMFELLTERHPFPGQTTSDTIAAILGSDPDWAAVPASTPARIHWLMRRCLEKDPKRRLHDAADARIEIDDVLINSGSGGITPVLGIPPRVSRREGLAWILVALAGVALAATVAVPRLRRPAAPLTSSYRSSIVLPSGMQLAHGPATATYAGRFALSPDGRRIAVVAAGADDRPVLWLRPLDTLAAQPLAGTEGAAYPFWSPDSRFIGFVASGKLKTIGVAGGPPATVAEAALGAAGSWNSEGVILFTPRQGAPIHRVSASGGTPAPVTRLDEASGDTQHWYPYFLPGGRRFLYFVVGSRSGGITDPRAVHIGSLDPAEPPKPLIEGGSNAKFAQGQLLFLRGTTLMAQPFDVERRALSGEAVPLAEGIQMAGGSATGVAGAFSVSETGELAYQAGVGVIRSELVWFDRSGKRLSVLGDRADHADVALSRDGSRAAASILDPVSGTRDVWLYDVARGIRERFTFHEADDFAPIWSADGRRIAFSSRRGGSIDIYHKEVSGAGPEELLLADPLGKFLGDWSPDGRSIVYVGGGGIVGRSDLWIFGLGDRKQYPLLEKPYVETHGQFSPDGQWLAYTAAEQGQGRFEVYVTSFPAGGRRWQVSTAGGGWPRWGRDSKEIFYLAASGKLMTVKVDLKPDSVTLGAATEVFAVNPRPMVRLDAYPYAVAPDGKRFLVNTFVDDTTATDITLVVNWAAALRK